MKQWLDEEIDSGSNYVCSNLNCRGNISITGISGNVGRGKNTYAALEAFKAQRKGTRVFSNYPIRGAFHLTIDQFLDELEFSETHQLVIIDEPYAWSLDSRHHGDLERALAEKILQSRKFHFDTIIIAQLYSTFEKRIRFLTDRAIYARKPDGFCFRYALMENGETKFFYLPKIFAQKILFPNFATKYVIKEEYSENATPEIIEK